MGQLKSKFKFFNSPSTGKGHNPPLVAVSGSSMQAEMRDCAGRGFPHIHNPGGGQVYLAKDEPLVEDYLERNQQVHLSLKEVLWTTHNSWVWNKNEND